MKGYGDSSSGGGSGANATKVQQTFDRYKDGSTGNMEAEGIIKFYEDLSVNAASDIITIYISCKLGANQMGVYTSAEFTNGFKAMGVSTVDDLKKKLP